MANWISSKLKVAETFFEQIDQQAAESLRKNERPQSEEQRFDVPAKTSGSVPLKDQLKKKTRETGNNNEYQGKLSTDSIINNVGSNKSLNAYNNSSPGSSNVISNGEKVISRDLKPSPMPKPILTDNDWTELLSIPKSNSAKASPGRGSLVSPINALRKDGRRQGSLLVVDQKKDQKSNERKSSGVKSKERSYVAIENKLNGKPSDGEESSSSARSSSVELQGDGKILDQQELEYKEKVVNLIAAQKSKGNEENGTLSEPKDSSEDLSQLGNKNRSSELLSVSKKIDEVSDVKKGIVDVYDQLRSTAKVKHQSGDLSRSSVSSELKQDSSSTSNEDSDSDGDSGSSSDSESERERERREKIFAEKVAAKAVAAIKERENLVARLEGEKQSLEKILEERAKQQVQEAAELQTTMMETMEAVELEKQKHNNTRMEALPRLAKLETANADLARSLATALKNLEEEINQVAEFRQQFELKEAALEELRRKISKIDQTGTYIKQLLASKGVEFEREILEAEYAFLTDKIGRLEDKARNLEANIEMTRKEMEDSTEVEIELKRRLGQLTDHLIQKQAQVEALSSEKATLFLRIEAVSKLLDENESTMNPRDLESGAWEMSDSKPNPLLNDKIRSGKKHFGSLVQQLDAIFMAGAVFLRRNSTAKLGSLVYLVCLHFWVIYILISHSKASNEGRSGAVFSLENINNSTRI